MASPRTTRSAIRCSPGLGKWRRSALFLFGAGLSRQISLVKPFWTLYKQHRITAFSANPGIHSAMDWGPEKYCFGFANHPRFDRIRFGISYLDVWNHLVRTAYGTFSYFHPHHPLKYPVAASAARNVATSISKCWPTVLAMSPFKSWSVRFPSRKDSRCSGVSAEQKRQACPSTTL